MPSPIPVLIPTLFSPPFVQHDLQLDYYGKRLATCSSDNLIKVFEVGPDQGNQTISATIAGHEGPIWQVAWAHPKFGIVLASCSYDRRVCVWKEFQAGQWTKIYEYMGHQSSVNSISFAPHELGLKLACASNDCSISVLTWRGGGEMMTWHALLAVKEGS